MYSALDLYVSVVLLLVASAALGQGVLCVCGRRTWSWLAPAVGLATLVVLAGATIRLPGRDLTATAIVGIFVLASLVLLWVRRPQAPGAWRAGLPVAVLVVLVASLAFAAAGGFGAFEGKSNDLGYYLYDAQWLQTHDGFEPVQIVKGFPMGPPALAVVTANVAGGASLVATFTAFMITVAVAAALASLAVLGRLSAPRRIVGALLVGLPYMVASFYVQSSFKEVATGLFALTFALSLRELAGEDRHEESPRPRPLAGIVPLGLLLAASVYAYSFAGTYWALGTLGLWVVASVVINRRDLGTLAERWRPQLPGTRRGRIVAAVVFCAVVAVAIPESNQVVEFARARGSLSALSGGGVAGDLPGTPWFYTALGIWPVTDYRAAVPNMGAERVLFGIAVIMAVRGLFLLWRGRELAILSVAGATLILYLAARIGSGPYVQSKALAVMAPAVMLVAVWGALTAFPRPMRGRAPTPSPRETGAGGRSLAWLVAWSTLATAFILGALGSTYLALGGALVNHGQQTSQLEALGRKIQGSKVLFLGSDDYIGWELRGASVFSSDRKSGVGLLPPKNLISPRRVSYWARYDFDSMLPSELDAADYVITARSPMMSQPPPNFELAATTESFELWRRVGPTPPRRTLPEGALPGQELRCDTPRGRRLSRAAGVAHVWSTTPIRGLPRDWRPSSGAPASKGFRRRTALVPGRTLTHTLPLPAGRWTISLQYHSADPLHVRGPGLDVRVAPNSQRLGSFWPVGTIRLRKPERARFTVQLAPYSKLRDLLDGPDRLNTGSAGLVAGIGATPADARRATVPLRAACGQFVDWYRKS